MNSDDAYNTYLIHSIGNMNEVEISQLPLEDLHDAARRTNTDLSMCRTLTDICETVLIGCASYFCYSNTIRVY